MSITIKNYTLLFFLFFIFIFSSNCSPQTDSLLFKWTDSNSFDVTFDVFEVSTSFDTSFFLQRLNPSPIVCDQDSCSWPCVVVLDDSIHYFRMRSTRFDSIYSVLSNLASIRYTLRPVEPLIIDVSFPSNRPDR